MLQLMERTAATVALLRALTTTTFDEVSSLKICLPTGKVLQQASVCLSVGSSVSPLAYPIHGRPVACCSAQQSRRFQRAAAVFFGGGKKLRVAITFYSFALKSLKLLRPDVIS